MTNSNQTQTNDKTAQLINNITYIVSRWEKDTGYHLPLRSLKALYTLATITDDRFWSIVKFEDGEIRIHISTNQAELRLRNYGYRWNYQTKSWSK